MATVLETVGAKLQSIRDAAERDDWRRAGAEVVELAGGLGAALEAAAADAPYSTWGVVADLVGSLGASIGARDKGELRLAVELFEAAARVAAAAKKTKPS